MTIAVNAHSTRLRLHAEALLDFHLAGMDEEIAQGWRCMYAREIWFRENLPPPLLSESGRAYQHECWRMMLDEHYQSPVLETRFSQPPVLDGYRNFLNVGFLEAEPRLSDSTAWPWDLVANETVLRFLHGAHRHYWHEIRTNQELWWQQVAAHGTLTPPHMLLEAEIESAVRNEEVALANDTPYWRAHYSTPDVAARPLEYSGVQGPDWILKLMAELGPDFQADVPRSTRRRLVFVQESGASTAWSVVFEMRAESRFPLFESNPRLVLIDRSPPHARSVWRPILDDCIATKKFQRSTLLDGAPRGLETLLRYSLPRFRKFIAFYDELLALPHDPPTM